MERTGGGIPVTRSGGLGEEELAAFPQRLDPDDHAFYTVSGDGAREPLEFDLGGPGRPLRPAPPPPPDVTGPVGHPLLVGPRGLPDG